VSNSVNCSGFDGGLGGPDFGRAGFLDSCRRRRPIASLELDRCQLWGASTHLAHVMAIRVATVGRRVESLRAGSTRDGIFASPKT